MPDVSHDRGADDSGADIPGERRIVRLQYPEGLIREPLLSRMILRYRILANIRRARVTETVGEMVLEMSGEPGAVESGIRYLQEAGVIVEPVLGDVLSP